MLLDPCGSLALWTPGNLQANPATQQGLRAMPFHGTAGSSMPLTCSKCLRLPRRNEYHTLYQPTMAVYGPHRHACSMTATW